MKQNIPFHSSTFSIEKYAGSDGMCRQRRDILKQYKLGGKSRHELQGYCVYMTQAFIERKKRALTTPQTPTLFSLFQCMKIKDCFHRLKIKRYALE